MGTVANIVLVIAVAAFVPSAGTFTPAIFLSAAAAIVAVLAIASGHIRRGFLTIYLAFSAAVVSPIVTDLQRADIWLLVLAGIGGIAGVVLYVSYRKDKLAAR